MRVLLVEDDDLVRATLTAYLAGAGHDVVEAADGEQGLAEIARQMPDAIVCDRMMPKLSGFEMLEVIRRDWPSLTVPFIFLSALADERDLVAVAELNPFEYLAKPIRRTDLLDALNRAAIAPR